MQKNYPIKFTLVEGLSNSEAQKVYDSADILIDQLIVGWYGGVAVELMARGVPVMCYLNKDDLTVVGQQFSHDLPIINTSIDSIYDDLEKTLILPSKELRNLGVLSRHFVEKYHVFHI